MPQLRVAVQAVRLFLGSALSHGGTYVQGGLTACALRLPKHQTRRPALRRVGNEVEAGAIESSEALSRDFD